jgi:hypothetical protein
MKVAIDTINDQLVSAEGGDAGRIVVMKPARVMNHQQALRLAAWLLAIADPERRVYRSVRHQSIDVPKGYRYAWENREFVYGGGPFTLTNLGAVAMAAWLVAIAEGSDRDEAFDPIFQAVLNA